MPHIVISEFMDEAVVAALTADYDVLYDPDLVEARASLEQAVRTTPALIVRNRTQVRGPLLEAERARQLNGCNRRPPRI